MNAVKDLMTGPWSGLVIALMIAVLGPLLARPAERWLRRTEPPEQPPAQQNNDHGNNAWISQKGNGNVATLDQRTYDQRTNHHHHYGSHSSGSDGDELGLFVVLAVVGFAALVAVVGAFAHVGTTPLSLLVGIATGYLGLTWRLTRRQPASVLAKVRPQKALIAATIALALCWYTVVVTSRTTYQGATFDNAHSHAGQAWLFDAWTKLTIAERWLLGHEAAGNLFAIFAATLVLIGLTALRAGLWKERTRRTNGWIERLSSWHSPDVGAGIIVILFAALGLALAQGLLITPMRNLGHHNTIGTHGSPTPAVTKQHGQ